MTRIAVPFFMGSPMAGFEVPNPHLTVAPPLPQAPPQVRMGVLYRELRAVVASVPDPEVWAGDCVATIGVLAGLQRRGIDPVVVWFDAHGDYHTWETTPSGFIGGMPLAMLVGKGEQTIVEAAGLRPIPRTDVVLVDARDLDPGEPADELTVVSVEEAVWAIPKGRPVYVHIDVDVVGPSDMPAVNYPAEDGPSLESVASSLAAISAVSDVVACSVSSWNPELPGAATAAAATASLVASCR